MGTSARNEGPATPPEFDAAAVGRVVPEVEIEQVQLVGAHFQQRDDGALVPMEPVEAVPEEMGVSVEWEIDAELGLLGCALTFATSFPEFEEAPYEVVARFRLVYRLLGDEPPAESDCEKFVYWNAVFNAWPYWREYLSSTVNRAQLPRFIAPVMRIPRTGDVPGVPPGL